MAQNDIITHRLLEDARKTVGYHESDNKNEFMKGADVAISKAQTLYEEKIKALEQDRDRWEKACETIKTDMYTLTSIITKYSDNGN